MSSAGQANHDEQRKYVGLFQFKDTSMANIRIPVIKIRGLTDVLSLY